MSLALNSVYASQRQSLLSTVFRIVRDAQIAEDLAQETYIRAKRAIDSAPIEHIEGYLHQTARNLALDYLRRKKTRSSVESETTDPSVIDVIASDVISIEDAIIERQKFHQFKHALAGLPKRAQAVLILSRIDEWPQAKIAEHLGISERTVFNDLKLALGHCRDILQRYEKP